ncbi:hypothetical protein OIE52_39355 [Streptomyces canus]|uniref:hypothetical protein n=1 Tax=Streptomyces canus TaxID=58343 RepID=UPI00324A51B2
MAARADEEREERPTSITPTRTSTNAPPARQGNGEATEVSLTQFRAKFPGWVSVTQGG